VSYLNKGARVASRPTKGKTPVCGIATGGERSCQLEGCRGVRCAVRWPDGKLTWPCSAGIGFDENGVAQLL
jgi:hypothetical protein